MPSAAASWHGLTLTPVTLPNSLYALTSLFKAPLVVSKLIGGSTMPSTHPMQSASPDELPTRTEKTVVILLVGTSPSFCVYQERSTISTVETPKLYLTSNSLVHTDFPTSTSIPNSLTLSSKKNNHSLQSFLTRQLRKSLKNTRNVFRLR